MTIMRRLSTLLAALFALCLAPTLAHAALEVDITKGNLDPLPIATADFTGANDQPAQVGADIARVIRADLDRSGLFKSIDPAAFIERNPNVTAQPRFPDWNIINAQALVVGRTQILPDG